MADKKVDNADVRVNENRDFYPEDAQERNFAEARRLAVENTEKDKARADEDAARMEQVEADEKAEAAKRAIPAKPATTASKNPEQVKTNE